MKILSVVGARPEFVQAAPVSRRLRERHEEILVHTGQHYDYLMSQAFFDELGIPAPDYNLEVGSGAHGRQTAEIMTRLEDVLREEKPDLVIVRGDTNSTLAGALAASKLHIPTAHIEAGERSYDRRMPEEINRLVTDCLADVHFCVSQAAVRRLASEGIRDRVYWVGDVMLDTLTENLPVARRRSDVLARLGLESRNYALVTVHRAANTDDPVRLQGIVRALNGVTETVIFPAHPRTRYALDRVGAEPRRARPADRSPELLRHAGRRRKRSADRNRLRRCATRGLFPGHPLPYPARRDRVGGNCRNRLEQIGRSGSRAHPRCVVRLQPAGGTPSHLRRWHRGAAYRRDRDRGQTAVRRSETIGDEW